MTNTLAFFSMAVCRCCAVSGAWSTVHYRLPNFSPSSTSASTFLKSQYEKHLLQYEIYFANVHSRSGPGVRVQGT